MKSYSDTHILAAATITAAFINKTNEVMMRGSDTEDCTPKISILFDSDIYDESYFIYIGVNELFDAVLEQTSNVIYPKSV